MDRRARKVLRAGGIFLLFCAFVELVHAIWFLVGLFIGETAASQAPLLLYIVCLIGNIITAWLFYRNGRADFSLGEANEIEVLTFEKKQLFTIGVLVLTGFDILEGALNGRGILNLSIYQGLIPVAGVIVHLAVMHGHWKQ
ncbi:MAG: hypothetical protein Q4B15_00590 [Lachnospiraceae bacterium]|nr:hypothetical protein [Lachnospiraceae bacterium]